MNTFGKMCNQIKEDAFNAAKELLEENGIPVCFGDIPIPNYRPLLNINEFISEEHKEKIKQEYISRVKNTAEQVIQCANCKLYERCFQLSLLNHLRDVSFNINGLVIK
jgi:hypothetical protein